jgi:hypothetical protein
MPNIANGNGKTRALRIENGKSLARLKLTPSQKAAICADILDGLSILQPTQEMLSQGFRVPVQYIKRARRLTPEQRQSIREGHGRFRPLITQATQQKLVHRRVATNGNGHADAELFARIKAAGLEHTLEIAAQGERSLAH